MLRRLHLLPGILGGIVLALLGVTGAMLAMEPPLQRIQAISVDQQAATVADVAEAILRRNDSIERIVRGPNGTLSVYRRAGDETVGFRADPRSGELLGQVESSAWLDLTRRLHRSFLMGDIGRGAAGVGALSMLILACSGLALLARRLGGWRALLRPIRGSSSARWHCELARGASLGLMLSAVTGCYLSLVTFEVLADPTGRAEIAPPPAFSNARPRFVPLIRMHELRNVSFSQLRELTFPRPGDPGVMRLVTSKSTRLLDRATGAVIAAEEHGVAAHIHEWIYCLHTGQGLWLFAFLLGLSALSVPVLAGTGTLMWWRRRRDIPRIKANAAAQVAETILLVGSEGGATWQFASGLHAALARSGHRVHTAPMNTLAPSYARAQQIIILTSTYGDGQAPASASKFLARLQHFETAAPVAVLGFGDRSFHQYCKFAHDIASAIAKKGCAELLPTAFIDRQSRQTFDAWCRQLGDRLGIDLNADVRQVKPATMRLKLIERTLHGEDVQAPTAILRFVRVPATNPSWWRTLWRRSSDALPRFNPGDLVGIIPTGADAPRFYSLGSSSDDGVIEICVRKQPGGACSTFLHGLRAGGTVEAFIKPNPVFRPFAGNKPLILIGAGAGIAPLVGTIRNNHRHRPIHLYWGGRHPSSDYLYEGDLDFYLSDRRLSRLRPIFSRLERGGYVQDRLVDEANVLRDLIRGGAQIMVCGSSQMASAVAKAIEQIIAPVGLDLADLRTRGRYVEDAY